MSQSETVKQLQAEARAAYKAHNTPETAAAARIQRGQAQANGNVTGGTPRGSRR
ncbi:hypothetical protein ACF053_29905 [Streptomyces kanasensis]|uniref:hypothetical protein n=1 Tax=Streptomyces kanasensis TaxID=936756 RepID=UPI0036FB31B4